MNNILLSISVACTLLLIQACGGGGGGSSSSISGPTYSGLTSEARVLDTNAESLATAAASGAAKSVVTEEAEDALPFVPRPGAGTEAKVVEISPKIALWIAQSGALYSSRETILTGDVCDAGVGSAIADTNFDGSEGTITFNNCGIYDGIGDIIYLTGTVSFIGTYDSFGNPSTLYMNMYLTASYGGDTSQINLTLNCVDLSGSPSCTVTSDFVGMDGRIYRLTDIAVIPLGVGFDVSATIYDPDYGYFTMYTTAPLAFECANGAPSIGRVVISGESSTSGIIDFPDCSGFTVTIDGLSTPYAWP